MKIQKKIFSFKNINIATLLLFLIPVLLNIIGYFPFVKHQSALFWLIYSSISLLFTLIVICYSLFNVIRNRGNVKIARDYFLIFSFALLCSINEILWIIVDTIAVMKLHTWNEMKIFYSVLEITNIFSSILYLTNATLFIKNKK